MHFSLIPPEEEGVVEGAHRDRCRNKDTSLPDSLTEPQRGLELEISSENERKM